MKTWEIRDNKYKRKDMLPPRVSGGFLKQCMIGNEVWGAMVCFFPSSYVSDAWFTVPRWG